MPKFKLPVTWAVCGEVEVEAKTFEDAVASFNPTDHETPDASEYVDGSFELTDTDLEQLKGMGYGKPVPQPRGSTLATPRKKTNPHIGSTLDSWLKEEGILEEVTAAAKKRALRQGACAIFQPDKPGRWKVRKSLDAGDAWTDVTVVKNPGGQLSVQALSVSVGWFQLEAFLRKGWDTWKQE